MPSQATGAFINKVVVLGTGLIGGSLLRRLRHAGLDAIGWDPDPATSTTAGLRFAACPAEAVADRDLVILACPLSAITGTMDAIAPHVGPDTIVTDVGSTKGDIAAHALASSLGDRFIPGHPMAGSQFSGLDASQADLFTGATWVLCPHGGQSPRLLRPLVTLLTASVGAHVTCMTPSAHDTAVALSSHIPHIMAGSLAGGIARTKGYDAVLGLAAGSFRDATRVAATTPARTVDMLTHNRDSLEVQWRHIRDYMDELVEAVRDDDVLRLTELFATAAALRERFDDPALAGTSRYFDPETDNAAELAFLMSTGPAGGQITSCVQDIAAVEYSARFPAAYEE